MKMKSENENGQKKTGKLAALYFTGTIMFMSLAAVFLLLGHEAARSLIPVGLGMTAAGLAVQRKRKETKGEQEDEKRG